MYRQTLIAATVAIAGFSSIAMAQSGDLTRDPAQVQSGNYVLDPDHGKITWSVDHMGFSTYVGQFTEVSATMQLDAKDPTASKLEAQVQTASITSLNLALDKHLKSDEFLDVEKYPTASFKATSIRLTGGTSAEITGNLTLRGVTRPVVLAAEFNQAGKSPADGKYTVGFDGWAQIKRSDFGSTFALPILGDNVTLHFEAEFKLQEEASE